MPPMKLLAFDCDSTLSAIEGIDELGRSRGPEVFAAVEAMTHDAMNGRLAVEAVFGRRLEIIQPTRAHAEAVGRRYVEAVEPTARSTITALRARGWTPIIISGGFRPLIAPLAAYLEIGRIEAVDLYFNADGSYRGYDTGYPTTRSGGKPEIVAAIKRELQPQQFVMVGDGVSDLETKPVVDRFVGFGRYTARERVKAEAHDFVFGLDALLNLL